MPRGSSTAPTCRTYNNSLPPHHPPESTVPVYQILLILWVVVFAFWLGRQFSEYNRRRDR